MKTEAFLPQESIWPRVALGVFLLVSIALLVVTAETRVAVTFLVTAAALVLIAWRFPYAVLSLWMPLSFLLGIQVLVSTGYYRVGERTFGTTLELSVGELIALGLVVAWALRMLLLWRGRRDRHWQPWLPLAVPFVALAAAHALSYFGPGQPALAEVARFVVRYQIFLYLSCIALVVNFVRSKKRLRNVLLAMTLLGTVFAVDGLRNMLAFGPSGVSIRQAQPAAILEVNPLGGNQHSLAETLIVCLGAALAYAAILSPTSKRRRLALWAAGLMFAVAILTFSRTAWVVLALEAFVLGATVFRDDVRRFRRVVLAAVLAIIPLAGLMVAYSLTLGSLGSLDARAALTAIAWTLFLGSPWVGVGAGTFAARVTNTYAYLIEFGVPLDSHGVIQKIAAEAGLAGLVAFGWVAAAAVKLAVDAWKAIPPRRPEFTAYVILVTTAGAIFLYQLTSTSYWTPRMWVPVGLMLAAGRLFRGREVGRDPDFLRTTHV
ncbi:O-antigen ligase domain-containing protein [Candidatus Uhrbacteria bacterium]|nr:MAG: O-antigen ligase domain-containing protein [Candidatus Uhrbacteria bacterium]